MDVRETAWEAAAITAWRFSFRKPMTRPRCAAAKGVARIDRLGDNRPISTHLNGLYSTLAHLERSHGCSWNYRLADYRRHRGLARGHLAEGRRLRPDRRHHCRHHRRLPGRMAGRRAGPSSGGRFDLVHHHRDGWGDHPDPDRAGDKAG